MQDVITHSCTNFNDGLAKTPLKLDNEWAFIYHYFKNVVTYYNIMCGFGREIASVLP